jgi:hypothetical protein
MLAELGVQQASVKFTNAQYDGANDVNVFAEWQGDNVLRIVASGQAVAFIEFGTGVTYMQQHPKAGQFGAVRGAYGHHLGRLKSGWRYKGDAGTNGTVDEKHAGYIHTFGNPPAMAMYYTAEMLKDKVTEIAREVYGS